jgi:metal-responsive CopG/Arc/MetJ family transcriptional regulator
MKTAVSVPDDLFRLAETAARRLHVSRSQLYATALAEYLERETAASITDRLNQVYSDLDSKLDSSLMNAQLASLDRESW